MQRGVVNRVVVAEQLLVTQGIGTQAVLGLHDPGELLESPTPDSQRERGVAGGGEPEHAEAVHRPSAAGLGVDQIEGEVLVDGLLRHLVVVAAGPGEPHDVPVAEERHLGARYEVGPDDRHSRQAGHQLAVA